MNFSPVFFRIGSVEIYFYGVIMALAVALGIFVSNYIRGKYYSEISEDAFFDTAFVTIISGFIGARLYYCILNFAYYMSKPMEILDFRQGGLSIHGGLILGIVVGMLFAKLKKYPILKLADICVYGLVLAQSIGRWGNFFNSEAFGKPTDIFCKMYIKPEFRPVEYIDFSYFHPTFLYESILNICIFLILFLLLRKLFKNYEGLIFISYLVLYSIVRFFVELLRIDSRLHYCGLPLPAVVSLVIALIATILFVVFKHFQDKKFH